MSKRTANDNIKTSHLKCEHCGTRAHLTSITSLGDRELRAFQCNLCGKEKILQLSHDSKALSRYSQDLR